MKNFYLMSDNEAREEINRFLTYKLVEVDYFEQSEKLTQLNIKQIKLRLVMQNYNLKYSVPNHISILVKNQDDNDKRYIVNYIYTNMGVIRSIIN